MDFRQTAEPVLCRPRVSLGKLTLTMAGVVPGSGGGMSSSHVLRRMVGFIIGASLSSAGPSQISNAYDRVLGRAEVDCAAPVLLAICLYNPSSGFTPIDFAASNTSHSLPKGLRP